MLRFTGEDRSLISNKHGALLNSFDFFFLPRFISSGKSDDLLRKVASQNPTLRVHEGLKPCIECSSSTISAYINEPTAAWTFASARPKKAFRIRVT